MILGIVVLLYGGFQWVSNQPEESKPFVGSSIFSYQLTDGRAENLKRSAKRDDATKILIAGGIVAFVGLGISYSANKRSNSRLVLTRVDPEFEPPAGLWTDSPKHNSSLRSAGPAALLFQSA